MDYDKTDMPSAYDRGRSYSPERRDRWLDIVSDGVGKNSISEILDLGCGTGRYSIALSKRIDARVNAETSGRNES